MPQLSQAYIHLELPRHDVTCAAEAGPPQITAPASATLNPQHIKNIQAQRRQQSKR